MARDVSFLISEELIRQLSPIAGDLDFAFMYPHLLIAQDKWIQPKLGTKLYEELMTQVKASTVTVANALLLDDYIAKALVNWAMYKAFSFLAVKMVNSGIVQRVVDDGNPITITDAERLGAKCREDAEWYTQRLIDFLCANPADYPLYKQADPGDIKANRTNWSGGLNLGPVAPRATGTSGAGAGAGYSNPLPVEKTVGGIEIPDTFFLGGKTFAETMDQMFYPLVLPTFVAPSNGFGDNVSNLQEIAAAIAIQFTATFDKGQILINGVPTQDRSGPPNNYNYLGTGLPANFPSVLLTDVQNLVGYVVLIGLQSWQSSVDYDAGPQPLDSKGNPSGSPLPAGTTGLQATSLEGVYPLFGTTVTITVFTKQTLQSMMLANNIVFNMVAESGGNKQTFDIPDAWLAQPRPLVDVETFNTFTLTWVSTGLAEWTTSPTTHTVQALVINYTRYVFNGVDRGAIQIRLKF